MEELPVVNRSAIMINPKQPYLDWVKIQLGDSISFRYVPPVDGNIYLIPDFEDVDDIYASIEQYLERNFDLLFRAELEAWSLDARNYPDINYSTFKNWFTASVHTLIFDTVDTRLKKG